jgi:hypothetical protein
MNRLEVTIVASSSWIGSGAVRKKRAQSPRGISKAFDTMGAIAATIMIAVRRLPVSRCHLRAGCAVAILKNTGRHGAAECGRLCYRLRSKVQPSFTFGFRGDHARILGGRLSATTSSQQRSPEAIAAISRLR